MREIFAIIVVMFAIVPAVFADTGDPYPDLQKETVILRLDTGNQVTGDDIQKLFTALATSYLKNNSSYILVYEVYRDRGRQELRSSLALTELDYGSFVVMNIRHTFSNGYYELKLSNSPFINFCIA
ncbi:hypothetical protein AGMMS4952_27680 [Spirochaetia bacterium]|nr:hypothetical protein AGMMS4952_27680 [Spirochaetia bacterium]